MIPVLTLPHGAGGPGARGLGRRPTFPVMDSATKPGRRPRGGRDAPLAGVELAGESADSLTGAITWKRHEPIDPPTPAFYHVSGRDGTCLGQPQRLGSLLDRRGAPATLLPQARPGHSFPTLVDNLDPRIDIATRVAAEMSFAKMANHGRPRIERSWLV